MSKYVGFIEVAENVFKDVYPEIAKNIINIYKKTSGLVVEVGCGTAILSRNLLDFGNFDILALDLEYDMAHAAKNFIRKENKNSILPLVSNVEHLPLKSNLADLIISRGSVFFWEDKNRAFNEIYRILKKGGIAYIGGGFGNKALKEKIETQMLKKNPNWQNQKNERLKQTNASVVESILKQTTIHTYKIINDDSGFWILMYKE